jgi:hypothetical protein
MPSPYLQHLVTDPNFGYLFPHRLAIAAFGVANEYQLRKHFPKLQDGLHFVKIRGNDNVERLFYTLDGLLAIADLIGSPQAQSFKTDLIQQTQSGGALVPAPVRSQPGGAIAPAPVQLLSGNPTASLYTEVPEPSFSIGTEPGNYSLAHLPADHPITMLTQALTPQLERAIERSVAARMPSPQLPQFQQPQQPLQTPQDTAALIFEAQHLANSHTLEAQRLVANQRPNVYHVEETTVIQMSPIRRANTWLNSQDPWALTLMSAGLFAMLSFSAYALTSAVANGNHTRYQPQMETYK